MKSNILSTIGHTPLIRLKKLYSQSQHMLFAKLEMFNMGGSIKDRPAFRMISKALEQKKINRNSTIIESSSGNMAIGLAQVCLYFDLNLIVVVDPKINTHTLQILKAYGIKIEQVNKPVSDGNYLMARLHRVQELLDSIPNSYWPNQYANPENPAAHHATMHEICVTMRAEPDYIIIATSTCGTIMGCSDYIHQHNLKTKIVAVDAVGSILFDTPSAPRLVPGHGAGRKSELLDAGQIDHVFHISDEECIGGCRKLLKAEAILAGGSSGAIVTAFQKLEKLIPEKSTCVLLLADSGERYLDTIYNDEWVKENFGKSECNEFLTNTSPLPTISNYQCE